MMINDIKDVVVVLNKMEKRIKELEKEVKTFKLQEGKGDIKMKHFNKYRVRAELHRQHVEIDSELKQGLQKFYDEHGNDDELIKFVELVIKKVAIAQYELGAERQKLAIEDNYTLTKKAFEHPIPLGSIDQKEQFIKDFS